MFFLLLMLLEISFSQRKVRTRLNTVVHGRNGLDDVYVGTEEYLEDTSEEYYVDCNEQIYDCGTTTTTTTATPAPPGKVRMPSRDLNYMTLMSEDAF